MSPDCRLTKRQRLLKRSEFLWLSKNGRKTQNRHFIAVYRRRDDGVSRIGITVSRRVGNAVTRNRIKRHCREAFRCHAIRSVPAMDIMVIAKREAARIDGAETRASVEKLFNKIRGDVS